jgi:hypothetical protein
VRWKDNIRTYIKEICRCYVCEVDGNWLRVVYCADFGVGGLNLLRYAARVLVTRNICGMKTLLHSVKCLC